jgi:flagellar basal body-associated protein FliL
MSEKKSENAPAAAKKDGAAEAPARKKLPIKVLGIVGVLMIAEGAGVFMVLGAGKPKASGAAEPAKLVDDSSEKTQEIELVTDKFQNMTSGHPWVWDLSIFLQVKNKSAERVGGVLEQRQAEIKEGLGQIVGRARHSQLAEPEKQTLTRQVGAFLEKMDGLSADGKPLIERVIISKCRGFQAD